MLSTTKRELRSLSRQCLIGDDELMCPLREAFLEVVGDAKQRVQRQC